MEKLLKGIYYTIDGYIHEADKRRKYLQGLLDFAHKANYEEDAIKAYEDEYERLSHEIQVLEKLAEEINKI